jgi:myo-inositol-1(or 4)-monophosphatase
MKQTADFLAQAQTCIEKVFKDKRAELVQASGSTEHQFKYDESVVTTFDKDMELELKHALQTLDSGIGYEGEEFGHEGNRQTFWLVDPIDGTESFIRGLPTFRNMVTLIDNGKPVYAVVYRPVSDELFIATQGGGTFVNGKKLVVSQRPIDRVRVEFATKYRNHSVQSVLAALEPKVENIRFTDEFLYVVEGKLDVHLVYKSGTKPWDNAPRMLLLAETGAKVANIGSDDFDYMNSDFLAANPLVFDQIMQCINQVSEAEI